MRLYDYDADVAEDNDDADVADDDADEDADADDDAEDDDDADDDADDDDANVAEDNDRASSTTTTMMMMMPTTSTTIWLPHLSRPNISKSCPSYIHSTSAFKGKGKVKPIKSY